MFAANVRLGAGAQSPEVCDRLFRRRAAASNITGEFDAQAYNSDIFVKQLKEWVDKELVHFHVVDEIPHGYRFPHAAFDGLPALDKFVKNDSVRKVVEMHRNFTLIGSPFILPPSTPKEQVQILLEAMRKAFRDSEFVPNLRKRRVRSPLHSSLKNKQGQ